MVGKRKSLFFQKNRIAIFGFLENICMLYELMLHPVILNKINVVPLSLL